jgi:hypothetical protein
MVGFVDDSTGTSNDFRPQTQSDTGTILKQMQHDAQAWNDLLWCTGGKLELPKCSFHTLHFAHSPDGSAHPILTNSPNTIDIQDSLTNEIISVPSKPVTEAHRTLGHWKSPADQNQTTQLKALVSKAKSIATLIHIANVSRFGATLAYHGIYIASLKFVLPQCFFTLQALNKAERSTIPLIVAKCGYNRNTSTALRYAPLHFAGAGLSDGTRFRGKAKSCSF